MHNARNWQLNLKGVKKHVFTKKKKKSTADKETITS